MIVIFSKGSHVSDSHDSDINDSDNDINDSDNESNVISVAVSLCLPTALAALTGRLEG